MTATDLEEIYTLQARYAVTVDENKGDEWADCFTTDGVFTSSHQGSFKGVDALRTYCHDYHTYLNGRQARHVISNVSVEIDGDNARGTTYLTLYETTERVTTLVAIGQYHDIYLRHEGKWRFASREIIFD